MTATMIQGAGGGGGKGGGGGSTRAANEAPNTLQSRQVARVIDLISEGEIVGLANGSKSLFLDDTPFENADGSTNFQGLGFDLRLGLPDQAAVPGFSAAETTVSVGVRVRNGSPVVRTVTDPNADAVRVAIRLPSLTSQDTQNGDLNGASVRIRIDVAPDGGAFANAVDHTFDGKTTSAYVESFRIALPGTGPWQVRVTRVTADSTSVALQNETEWSALTIIRDGKFKYPHSALMALTVNAEQFGNSIPVRSYEIKGRVLQVPVNYDPETRTYTGIWDGTFKLAWSNNPAWVLYDLMTNPRYGLGRYVAASQVDKWSLYRIAQYCDQPVGDGYGGLEPRFTFNGVLGGREDAYKVLQSLASVFRGMVYWASGSVSVTADMPDDPVKLVSKSNVIDGRFSYSGSALKARHTAAMVAWNDPGDGYRQAIEVVEDQEQIVKYGYRPVELTAVGCTSRGQAHRVGRWVLASERLETETVTYEAAWDNADVMPGQVIQIADPDFANVRFGGRIVTSTATSVTLDAPVQLLVGETYDIAVVLPDGSVVSRSISNPPGTSTVISFAGALPQTPVPGAQWSISGTEIAPRLFRVLANQEVEKGKFRITALLHQPGKYGEIETGIKFDPLPYTRPANTIGQPRDLRAVETRYTQNGVAKSRISVSWTAPSGFGVRGYIARYRTPAGNWVERGFQVSLGFDIEDAVRGEYVISVATVGQGITSTPVELTFTALGWSGAVPAYVSHLELYLNGSGTVFYGRDINIRWRGNFPGTANELGTDAPTRRDPSFLDYQVSVYDHLTDRLLRTDFVQQTTYVYSFEMNNADAVRIGLPGARRKVRFEVSVRTIFGQSAQPAKLTVENPAPATINPRLSAGFSLYFVEYPIPSDTDFEGVLVWASTSSGFPLNDTTLVYDGKQNFIALAAEPNVEVFVRIAGYDAFGKTDLNVSDEESIVPGGEVIDITPPAIPTGLSVSSSAVTEDDGSVFAQMTVTWDPVADEDIAGYEIGLREGAGSWINTVVAPAPQIYTLRVKTNTAYEVRIRAFDTAPGRNVSGYSTIVSHTTAKDTTPPGALTDVSVIGALRTLFALWTGPVDNDLASVEIWESETNDRADAVLVATADARPGSEGAFSISAREPNTTYYYWLRAVDTSGNAGPWHTGDTAGTMAATIRADTVDILPNAITTPLLAAGAVVTDKMLAGSINADRLTANTIIQQANTGTTKLTPGLVEIAGSTTLADWRSGADTTKIAGGSIAANSITANILQIGLRGIDIVGIEFEANKPGLNQVSWSAGTVSYVNDAGTPTTVSVSASSATYTGDPLYVYWTKGGTSLASTTDTAVAYGANNIILATYSGTVNLVVNYGRTIIDGSQIKTGTITASQLTTTSAVITGTAQIADAVITSAKIANLAADKIDTGTLNAGVSINVGGDRLQLLAGSQRLQMRNNAGTAVVEIGNLSTGGQGIIIRDGSGNTLLSTSGFGTVPAGSVSGLGTLAFLNSVTTGQVTGLGTLATQNTVSTGQVTGLGTLATQNTVNALTQVINLGGFAFLSTITSANISTYIAGAAIGTAYIADAAITNAKIGSLEVDNAKIANLTITNGKVGANQISYSVGSMWAGYYTSVGTLVTVGHFSEGNAVYISFSGHSLPQQIFVPGGGDGGGDYITYYAYAQLLRNGSDISGALQLRGASTFVHIDYPGAGLHFYSIYITSVASAPVTRSALMCMELKR